MILVVARRRKTCLAIQRQLSSFLGDWVQVRSTVPERGVPWEGADLILVSTMALAQGLAHLTGGKVRMIVARRTLSTGGWKKLLDLPVGTRALLVNDGEDTALETIELLRELGLHQIDLIPMYPGKEEVPDVRLAITPGERHLVPPGVDRVIDIGDRVLTPGVLIEVFTHFRRYDRAAHERIQAYLDKVVPVDRGLSAVLDEVSRVRQQLEQVLEQIDEGVIAVDPSGRITYVNGKIEHLLREDAYHLVGRTLDDVFGPSSWTEELKASRLPHDRLDTINGRSVIIRSAPGHHRGEPLGSVIVIRDVTEMRRMERKLRHKVRTEGHVARYTMEDIVGLSGAIQATKERALRLAGAESCLLITGETGTGKELFAQAVHNASPRKLYPFVAINCAAFPPSLLESELFGFEEGAFTGARKGGKEGLFELAHLGTIFLDEVADMSSEVQSRLLRVLQEGEVMRVGSTRVRRVDVRVIAATNRSLEELVSEGRFRSDLYHRLNILPLRVPPLRERPEDIPLLVDHFLRELGDSRRMPAEVLVSASHKFVP